MLRLAEKMVLVLVVRQRQAFSSICTFCIMRNIAHVLAVLTVELSTQSSYIPLNVSFADPNLSNIGCFAYVER
ncbi:hypothetical protein EGR_11301 [Echinococcus granulosus]|uniref:Uncharacterized protein n=1 Tax=Echinococcus granulosus TaxID=6210 RepID=W6TYP9_ECHGR|nr:hypothetical protein EGR_11301 [Echinococcus granulosus]EUB53848.1 hypothetical protein EGR_11301 [Echinococcus granulosus]